MAGPSKPAAKRTKIVKLSLPSAVLSRFPTATIKSESGTPALQDSSEKTSEGATPRPTDAAEDTPVPAQADGKKKRPAPNPNARKRAPPAIDPEGPSRARPGPKKKARTDANDTNDVKPAAASGIPAHKLGPKANTGAINAGLRALDRTGKPCRRWEKKGLQLKSFTGSVWNMPTWKGSQRPRLNADGEVQSDSSSDAKPVDASGLASEKSASALGDTTMMAGIESSPAPIAAA